MKATLWFWRSGTKTRKNTLDGKSRLSPLIFSKPKAKLFSRQRKLRNTAFKLFNLNQKKNNMSKRAFIIHGWDGYPVEGWFPWLKTELEKNGFQVQVPAMPEPAEPKIEAWVSHLSKVVGDVDENTYFVGHSIGCQTILRYLESLHADKKVGGATFVAGWFTLMNLETHEEKEIAPPWLETPIDFDKVKQHTKKFFAVFSDDDEVVPQENKKLFEERLDAKITTESGKGHFSGSDGVKELPVILEAILSQ